MPATIETPETVGALPKTRNASSNRGARNSMPATVEAAPKTGTPPTVGTPTAEGTPATK